MLLNRYSLGTMLAVAAIAQTPVMPELPKGPAKPRLNRDSTSPVLP